jgi:hypothetical protein
MFTNETIEQYRPAVELFADAFGRPEAVLLNFETGELTAIEDMRCLPELRYSIRAEYIYSTPWSGGAV